ncbi:NUDIX hydrolase [Pseudomonas sp. AN-1]|uniref:NUDIX hydrolase n=1 Tax=Pseudomonas sp. AN-1 TaxID=3096605 RepID=UPI002A6B2E82|nr:NUDIX hydrolase [Pseudomonas sp. AN-1]WPP47185.1 NUDIX hydrolase [Pseudomonas sp. AN-1]
MNSAEILASVDIVALRLGGEGLEVLLRRRPDSDEIPYPGKWALPGVLINGLESDRTLEDAVERALTFRAHIEPAHLEQVGTEGNDVRDPRGWSITIFYLALLAPQTTLQEADLRFVPLGQILDGSFPLPFDHAQLVHRVAERLASKSVYTALPLYLLGPRFTVGEALTAFEACLGQAVQHTTLRGRLEKMKSQGWIRDTGEKNQPPMGRPQVIYEHCPPKGEVFVFDRSLLA